MRGLVAGLASPFPLGEQLPALYQEDGLVQRMTSALDVVLAPAIATLDGLDAYLDPALTPDDFLEWLGGWVGIAFDDGWPADRRRAFVAGAADLYRQRGTVAGLAAHVEMLVGSPVEVVDSGGAAWSVTANSALPGTPDHGVVIRVPKKAAATVDLARLDSLIRAAKPAHTVHAIEVVGR